MKFKKSGRIFLAMVVSLGLSLGLTSCVNDYTVAYFYVTGAHYNQIGAFKIANNTGNLSTIPGSPFGSGGTNPVRAVVSSTGRYLYVLNAGAAQAADSTGNFSYSGGNITVYSIGGNGTLAPQQTYYSQGSGSIRLAFSSTGGYLYVLDQYAPAVLDSSNNPIIASKTLLPGLTCRDSSNVYHPTGDITVYSVDSNTGRLSLITNNQVTSPTTGKPLTYFPVGCAPVDFKVTSGYILTADTYDPTTNNQNTVFPYALNTTSGQLTTTQNTEFVTGASSISVIGSDVSSKYIYILDPLRNYIYYYTIGSNGLLQAVSSSPTPNSQSNAGNPDALTSDSKTDFLYVANAGPSSTVGQTASDISEFTISSNGVLANVAGGPAPSDSGPQCILEDPSNQYIYTADYNSSTVRGYVLDPNSGVLTNLRNQSSYATVDNPTWCVASGHTD